MDVKAVIDTRRKGDPEIALFIVSFILIGIGIATATAPVQFLLNVCLVIRCIF